MAGGHGGGSERWLVTYADMLTLLLALFIILYSISKADVQRFKKFQEGMLQAFHVDVLQGRDVPALDSSGAIVAQDASTTVAPVPVPTELPGPPSADDAVVTRLQSALSGLVPPDSRGGIVVGKSSEGVVISLYGVLLFDSGKADLRPEAQKVLDVVAANLRPLPYDIRVEGHTDSIQPDPGPYPSNWELSTERALAVTQFLIDRARIDPRRLSATGYAEFRPVASNATREGRLRNRRIDLVLVRRDSSSRGPQ
jgi:chemotaxis protein MotB